LTKNQAFHIIAERDWTTNALKLAQSESETLCAGFLENAKGTSLVTEKGLSLTISFSDFDLGFAGALDREIKGEIENDPISRIFCFCPEPFQPNYLPMQTKKGEMNLFD